MRRIAAALLVPVTACIALAGCGSSGSGYSQNANAAVKGTGTFDKSPKVTIPAQAAGSKLFVSTPIKGTGATLKTGDAALANVAVYKWSGKKNSLVDSTFTSG